MQLLQQLVPAQAPANTHSQRTGLSVRGVLRGGHRSKHPPQAVFPRPAIVPSANPQAHSLLSPSSHAKQLQCCGARRSYGEEPPENMGGGGLERQITTWIKDCNRVQELENTLHKWGSSFNYIHTSAAFVKAAKLAQDRPASAASVRNKLVHIWHEQYSQSGAQGLANVLWASSKLQVNDHQLWRDTLETFTQSFTQSTGLVTIQNLSNVVYALALHASRNKGSVPGLSKTELEHALGVILPPIYVMVMHPALEGVCAQALANIMWGIGKLVYPVDTATLSALLHALLHPRIAATATPQHWSNSILALSLLVEVCDLQAVLSQSICARLLSESVVGKVADSTPQAVANTLLALGRLSDGHQPPVSWTLAQKCAVRLLQGSVAANVTIWNAQDISNSIWACAKLQLGQNHFVEAVVANRVWLSEVNVEGLTIVAWAISTMNVRDLQFMRSFVGCSQQHLKQSHSGSVVDVAAIVCWAVAHLDMQALAAEAVALVQSPVVVSHMQRRLGNTNASRLWEVHTWLLKHTLSDGQGLSSCLTSGQLGVGKKAYEQYLASGGRDGHSAG